ncbi:MAG: sulfatase-like hydrolase/transferase, partial [Marinoscillum sp.]
MKSKKKERTNYMKAKKRCLTMALAFFILCLWGCQTQAEKSTSEEPNLLFIITDQQRYDALSLAGNDILRTQNLDKLAKSGAYFTNAYTPCAVCAPARASFLTGRTVENHGIVNNDLANGTNALEAGVMQMPTFDEILSDRGYVCEYYGKWHSPEFHSKIYQNPKLVTSNGESIFAHGGQGRLHRDYLDEHVSKGELKDGELWDTMTRRPYRPDPLDHTLSDDREERGRLQPDLHGELLIPKEHTNTAYFAKEVMAAIERRKDQKFSITASFHFPHAPMLPVKPYYGMYPPETIQPPVSIGDDMSDSPYRYANGRNYMKQYADPELIRYMISNYYGLVTEMDDWIGQIVGKLEELGLRDNTLIIFTSDHGEMLGAHGMREKNVFYEESAHVPLMISFPGRVEENMQVSGYVSGLDLFQTVMDYLQVDSVQSDGTSLRGLIEGTDDKHGEYVVTEWDYRGDVESNYMIVKDGWKMMIPYSVTSTVPNALFNLKEDPYETNNLLASEYRDKSHLVKAEELRMSLLEWLAKNGSSHLDGVR